MNYDNKKLVDDLIKRFKIEYDKNDRSGVYGFTQRKMAYNSNKIEGSTLTEKQTSSLFETGTLSSDGELLRSKDIEEATGHFIMFNNMLKTYDEELSESLIKLYHFDLKSGVFEDKANGYAIGDYKKRANIVSDINVALPSEVPERMKDLIEKYNSKEMHSLSDIVKFHAEYEKIHPFQDGNGRTGRIIMFKECLKNGVYPFIVEDNIKGEYYHALNNAQNNDDFGALIDFCEKEQKSYFDNVKNLIYSQEEIDDIMVSLSKKR